MYILGMDIGTTSVKVCVYDPSTKQVIAQQHKDTSASVASSHPEGDEQDVGVIVDVVNQCVGGLGGVLRQVGRVGVCGQMHGVVMWNQGAWRKLKSEGAVKFEVVKEQVSPLYTWQDHRCNPDFLQSLPVPASRLRTHAGYGVATLLWLLKNQPDHLRNYKNSGTIHDFLVAMLCDLPAPLTTDQNAASWGYFDTDKREWNIDILKSVNFPVNLLPNVVKSGEIVGKLSASWHGIPEGAEIGAAFGDIQCSTLATLESQTDAVLNVSTSAQLTFVVDDIFYVERDTLLCLPYFNDKHLVLAASLNGGNALVTFVKMLQQWLLDLGFTSPQSDLWDKLIALGSDAPQTSMSIKPLLLGERHSPTAKASVENIDLSNIQLGSVFRSLCEGLVENLESMMPREMVLEAGVRRVVGTGSGLVRSPVLRRAVVEVYGLPLDVTSSPGDAAKGAAAAVV